MWCRINHLVEYQDVKVFNNLVTAGYFYEYFQTKASEFFNETINREEIKLMIMYILYSSDYRTKKDSRKAKYKQLFKEVFPSVYEVFHEIKKRKYNRLAILNQRLEAYFILDLIYNRLKNKLKVPIITIHDSFALPAPYLEKAIDIITNEFHKKLGKAPLLKYKYWDYKSLSY
jgi:excinuclease UvrABC helicase subunit UvrB